MKKIILGALFLCFSLCFVMPVSYRCGIIVSDFKKNMKVANSNINYVLDNVLTYKTFIKASTAISPIIIFGSYFYGIDPIVFMSSAIINKMGYLQSFYAIQKRIGESQAFWYVFRTQPFNTIMVSASNVMNSTLNYAIPFVSGILVKKYVG